MNYPKNRKSPIHHNVKGFTDKYGRKVRGYKRGERRRYNSRHKKLRLPPSSDREAYNREYYKKVKKVVKKLIKTEVTDEELVKILYKHRDKFSKSKRGGIESSIMQIILEDELGVAVGVQKAYKLRERLEIEHPQR